MNTNLGISIQDILRIMTHYEGIVNGIEDTMWEKSAILRTCQLWYNEKELLKERKCG